LLAAPAGYGKTSLLIDWVERDERPSAWIALEARHDDPLRLIAEITAALERLGVLDDGSASLLGDHESGIASGDHESGFASGARESHLRAVALPKLTRALERIQRPVVIVLDDAQLLNGTKSLQVLTAIAEHLPPGSQLALASRGLPMLPLGRLRAHRVLLELRARDMAMTRVEAATLLASVKVRCTPKVLYALVDRTQGWPAGLYLAALSALDQPDADAALERFRGDDHLVAEYLRDELLSELDGRDVAFLMETSVLERLHGALCDAVLEDSGSASTLDRLARVGLPLAPDDRSHECYRCQRLLREMLLGELRHSRGEREAELHLRASAWYAEHDDLDSSIAHAVAAGDGRRVGELLWSHLPQYVTVGRNELVQRWLAHFSPQALSEHAPLALTAAHSALALGNLPAAEHWGLVGAAALTRASSPPRVASLPAGVAVIEAAVSRHGVVRMGRGAALAYDLEDDDSPWRPIFCLFRGVAEHLSGDRAQAREHLENGIHRSVLAAPSIETLCLSQLAMITIEEGDWERGLDLVGRAIAQVERHGLAGYPTSALAFAVSADVRSRAGLVDESKRDARKAAHLLTRLSDFIPWYEAETRIALARATLRLADVRAARTLLAEASQLARRVPDAVVFEGWLDETWGLVDSAATSALAGPAALTMAELRILRFLPTHLSFREIGLRRHVSTNTVKTQAHAVYRKLDVSSRSEAVRRASEIGLLDG
jgi:LuxR family maltose regulon positive regulatory protein